MRNFLLGLLIMAFPSVVTTATSTTGVNTSHTVSLPSGIASGDLLTVVFASDANVTHTWPAGWTELWDQGSGTAAGSGAYRRADGTEGTTITVTTSGAANSGHNAYRITGHHTTSDPEDGTPATGAGTTPDPPALTPSWGGTEDVLWIACFAHDGTSGTPTSPTNYGNQLHSGAFASCTSARRELAASSENPGTFTVATSDDWVANTLAIRPAAAGGRTTRNTRSWPLGVEIGMGWRMPA